MGWDFDAQDWPSSIKKTVVAIKRVKVPVFLGCPSILAGLELLEY